ncbi:peroxisomal membrane protein 11C [Diabrotica undecimpunctata]|uniref:peroxisomal membrane protein 11C n=1 Tax=Diabrotica undecimpunctata TaxID=50387 RepID=UPI003B635A12
MWTNVLNEICELLETYKGRDKILRTLSYVTKLIGGVQKNEALAKKFFIFSSQMSGARATLRLLDDLPMIQYNLQYGTGKNEPDKFMSQLGVLTNIIDQLYYPIEKMSWFAEHKLITGVDNNKWDTASSVCWVISTYLTLVKTLRYIAVLEKHKNSILPLQSIPIEKVLLTQKYEILTAIRLCLDFIHAVNTLPPGFLWSSKLKVWHVGFIGTLSSLLGIYQIFYKRSLK